MLTLLLCLFFIVLLFMLSRSRTYACIHSQKSGELQQWREPLSSLLCFIWGRITFPECPHCISFHDDYSWPPQSNWLFQLYKSHKKESKQTKKENIISCFGMDGLYIWYKTVSLSAWYGACYYSVNNFWKWSNPSIISSSAIFLSLHQFSSYSYATAVQRMRVLCFQVPEFLQNGFQPGWIWS